MIKANCEFCDREQIKDRIIYENKNFYVIASLGQISDGGHTLIIPKQHVPCLGAITDYLELDDLENLVNITMNVVHTEFCTKRNGSSHYIEIFPLVVFEHGIVGQTIQHAHLHIVPCIDFDDLTVRIAREFPNKIETLPMACFYGLSIRYEKNPNPYLFWKYGYWPLYLERPRVCWNPPAPSQYFRKVIAEALGRPERADWQNMDPVLDKKLREETIRKLKPCFK